ncbi:hypothetical protein WMZ97_08730 [Lentibacillus sp. N15]|uniref:hypothetical protein n=1 Tax=Lentibacillus songyuanensis TaxID=3136161 RepID=UPI0031BB07CE
MKHYLKLVHFEFDRFAKLYLTLIMVTIAMQFIGVIINANSYLRMANYSIHEHHMSTEAFLRDYGRMSFEQISNSLWFAAPIALSIAALIFYCFLIWYRDWFGKNTFIYRLLMLPTARLNIYLSKATSIFLMVLGLISLQLILLPLEHRLMQFIVPFSLRTDYSLHEMVLSFRYLEVLYPNTFTEFILHYGLGFMVVFVLFTVIMFERSYRWKGMVFGVLYGIFTMCLFLAPVILVFILENEYLYPMELLILEVILGLAVIAISIWVSHYLLKNKITV